jgi:adenine deaminase
VKATGKRIKVIDCVCGDLLTETHYSTPKTQNGYIISNPEEDVLKLVAINRYCPKEISTGFIRGIGIKNGAMATSISHDNHNLVVVGVSDEDIVKATNLLIENKGGMVVTSGDKTEVLQLEIAGLMTHRPAKAVTHIQEQIKTLVSEMGSELEDPFLTLSFMSLIVIPKIKLSSKGLFDVQKFEFTSLFEE